MANIADLQVSLNLDTSKFKADIAAATKDVAELKAALSGLRSKTFKIDLVGKCTIDSYNNIPQIIIEDYNIVEVR